MQTIALVGNPNVGKTAIFNALTQSFQHVGNWHGVTVDAKSAVAQFNLTTFKVVDLPGTYSLSPMSDEEVVTSRFVLENPDAIFINVVDINALKKGLNLTMQLLELGVRMVLAINFARGKTKLTDQLGDALKIPVLELDGRDKKQVQNLLERCSREVAPAPPPGYLNKTRFADALRLMQDANISQNRSFSAVKAIEGDSEFLATLRLTELQRKRLEGYTSSTDLNQLRFDFIDQLTVQSQRSSPYGWHRADKIILNKFLAMPIFLIIMCTIFFLTFSSVGRWLSDGFYYVIVNICGGGLVQLLMLCNAPGWIIAFVGDSLVVGLGTVFSFLPQIILLFVSLSFLEEVGYLARLAFVLEGIFAKVGLSGRSVFTLLMGFGCSTTAIMTSKNLESRNIRIKTALLTPYMSCSAKLPIYSVIGGAFFGVSNFFVICGLYLLGIVVAIVLAFFLEKTFYRSPPSAFILEMPPYRKPSARHLWKTAVTNTELFAVRVGTVLLLFIVILWFLQNFTFGLSYITEPNAQISILEALGGVLAPLFSPLGFGIWGAVSALLCGLAGKEIVVATIAVLNGVSLGGLGASLLLPESAVWFTSAGALSFLTFCLLYTPCVASISTLRREVGARVAWIFVACQTGIAWVVSLLVYHTALVFSAVGAVAFVFSVLTAIFVLWVLIAGISRLVNRRTRCMGCLNCNHCDQNCKNS